MPTSTHRPSRLRRGTGVLTALGLAVLAAAPAGAAPATAATAGCGTTARPVLAVNAGGAALDSGCVSFTRDAHHDGGRTSSASRWRVTGTSDVAPYESVRVGMRGYRLPVPDGTYTVTLKMVENWWGAKGKRLFDVSLEGRQVLSSYDVFAAAGGKFRAHDRTFTTTVSDGRLDVSFRNRRDLASIAAITVTPSGSGATERSAPAAPATSPVAAPAPAPTAAPKPAPTTAPTAPQPASTAPTSARTGALPWAPPQLTNPTTVHVPVTGADLRLDQSRDYVVRLPANAYVTGEVAIWGGRNVVVIGGGIANPGGRALKLQGQTQSLHVEGLHLTGGSGRALSEGINLDQRHLRAGGVVRFQNLKVDTVRGASSRDHADVLQCWAFDRDGVLQVANVDASTDYQAIMWQPEKYGDLPKRWEMRDVTLRRDGGRAYLVYLTDTGKRTPTAWQNVRLVSDIGRTELYPRGWSTPGVSDVTSAPSPILGRPGPGYTSPGYR